ncbi:hypothetical protein [Ferruginibacter sp. SUN106]|uniref:hypothetical protein n=1 Tax=Ferruginibacter sp. SUN106 TaxID=2978348 RepID=UPI003D35D044
MTTIPVTNTVRLQSPFLYCQAAGSRGDDGSERGIHVRWDYLRELGTQHIPKGKLFKPVGMEEGSFNRENDFVSLYRTSYQSKWFTKIDLNAPVLPGQFFHAGDTVTYEAEITHTNKTNNVEFRFADPVQLGQLIPGLSSTHPLKDLLTKYTGLLEISIPRKLFFKAAIIYENAIPDNEFLHVECISLKNTMENSSREVIRRSYYDSAHPFEGGSQVQITGENIQSLRLVHSREFGGPSFLFIQTYKDYFDGVQQTERWEHVEDFGLSLDDNEVFTRLQGFPYTGGLLQLSWPKYNDVAQVNPANYATKWLLEKEGLKAAVEKYLELSSKDNPSALVHLKSSPDDMPGITVSMLDMLKLAASDFHVARMLGLGYLDKNTSGDNGFIYAAFYQTLAPLPMSGALNDHIFMSLPTTEFESRLPSTPLLERISYGHYAETNEDGNDPVLLSDPMGYSFFENTRYINLHKKNQQLPQPVRDSIPLNDAFDSTIYSPVCTAGIEYRRQNETLFHSPEILNDPTFTDPLGVNEVITIPDHERSFFYTHGEIEQGIHEYGVYAINWFSRASPISNILATDITLFKKRNTLFPPSNLAVQYIQKEDPLIFTTSVEQQDLAAAEQADPDGDHCKTRVVFDWDNFQNNAYQFADKVEFFFRKTPLAKIEGLVKEVLPVTGKEDESLVIMDPFTISSVSKPVTITPVIAAADIPKYTGSIFNTGVGQFPIVSINPPAITVRNTQMRVPVSVSPSEPVVLFPDHQKPRVGDKFSIIEKNDASDPAWTRLSQTVTLIPFSKTKEIVIEPDGSQHEEFIGGIYGQADIREIYADGNPTGGYKILFQPGTDLNPHPDPAVNWTKGSVRLFLQVDNTRKKRLAVISITSTSPLGLVAFDPGYFTDQDNRVDTGNQLVNFHPGYRVYLSPEPGVFDSHAIMPPQHKSFNHNYLAARSIDSTIPLNSPLTSPAVLLARNLALPLPPVQVSSPAYATRPDVFKKSTYTLDIKLDDRDGRIPFAMLVYRATDSSILSAIYAPGTLQLVMQELKVRISTDPEFASRWISLLNAETDAANNSFLLFGNYRFPNPDNPNTNVFIPDPLKPIEECITNPFPLKAGEKLVDKIHFVTRAIEDAFSPLTQVPVIFQFLKYTGQTSAALPRLRDLAGHLLNANDQGFDPFPMAVNLSVPDKFTDVRYTDYSFEGNNRNIFFYFVKEIGVNSNLSARSAVVLVKPVDTTPPESPKIGHVEIVEEQANGNGNTTNSSQSVSISVIPFIETERVKKIRLYRAYDPVAAVKIQNMKQVAETDTNVLTDDFSDSPIPPFGQPLYYRVVALREIENENGNSEYVPSLPSQLIVASIIDQNNPPAPVITKEKGTVIMGPDNRPIRIADLVLKWEKTVHNGSYHLYSMTSTGNWRKLVTRKTNADDIRFPEKEDLGKFEEFASLKKLDENGNIVYHHFKIITENSSGLLSIEERIFTI